MTGTIELTDVDFDAIIEFNELTEDEHACELKVRNLVNMEVMDCPNAADFEIRIVKPCGHVRHSMYVCEPCWVRAITTPLWWVCKDGGCSQRFLPGMHVTSARRLK